MDKKKFLIFAGFILSLLIITGCNNNDQDPPPPENNNNQMIENKNMSNPINNDQNIHQNRENVPGVEDNNPLKDDDYDIERERMEPAEDPDNPDDTGKKVVPLG